LNVIDWQAYLDGSLSAEQKLEADRLLASSEEARRELDGLRALQTVTRNVGSADPVPMERLEKILRKASPKRRVSLLRIGAAVAPFAVAAGAAYFVFVYDPMRLDRSPTREVIEAPRPLEAANWVRSKRPFGVPVIDLGKDVEIAMSRVGDNWACYDFLVEGKVYYLYMSPDPSPLRNAKETRVVDGTTFYYGRGVGWEQRGLGFYIKRGDDAIRVRLAQRINQLLKSPEPWNLPAPTGRSALRLVRVWAPIPAGA
jgi:hypothetical protein